MHFLNHLIYHELPSICEGASFGTGLSTVLENDESADPTEWLHRNDNYVPRPRGPHTVLSGPLPTSGESGEHNLMLFFIKKNKAFRYMLLYLLQIYLQKFIYLSGAATM